MGPSSFLPVEQSDGTAPYRGGRVSGHLLPAVTVISPNTVGETSAIDRSEL